MHNNALDGLVDYPFDRLRALLGPLSPPGGLEPLTMSLGEPQHPPPALVAEEIARHADLWGRYPPIAGSADLLEAIRDWLTRRYDLPGGMIEADRNIVAVSGTREALYMAGDLAVPGAKNGAAPTVLMPNPFYQVYQGAAVMARGEPVYLAAHKGNGFLPDFAAAGEDKLARAALAYLCSPANPQGAIADLGYLKELIGLAQKHDFVLCLDECYAEIYDREKPPGALQACAEMGGDMTNLLVFHSLSKRSSVPGLRSGFVAGDPGLIRQLKVLRNYGGATLPGPILAASAALWRDEAHVEANRALYRRKFDIADELLAGRLGHYRPEGGFYLWLDVGDGEAAAARLWSEGAIRVIPGVYLARPDETGANPGKGYIRVALVHDPEVTAEGIRRISQIL